MTALTPHDPAPARPVEARLAQARRRLRKGTWTHPDACLLMRQGAPMDAIAAEAALARRIEALRRRTEQ